MLIEQKDIQKYIPQAKPIVMVDSIIEVTENTITTGFLPLENNMFSENGFFSESGLVENMAQTAAAKAGYEARLRNLPSPVGFIGAVKNLMIHRLPKVGEPLTTFLEIKTTVMNVTIAQIKTEVDGVEIASAEMKIFLQEGIEI